MTTLYQDIRATLQTRATTAAEFPTERAYEGVVHQPTRNVPWARITLIPSNIRPYAVDCNTKAHRGMLQVSLFYPTGNGTAAVEAAADHVRDVFQAGSRLPLPTGELVNIDYSERGPTLPEPDWISVPVTVGWRCFSPRN